MQDVGLHHMQLPCDCHAEPAQQKRDVCRGCLQPVRRHSPAARAATTQASRAIKQRSRHDSPSSPLAVSMLEVLHADCYLCSNQDSAADVMNVPAKAALPQQECCCDCGYVTGSPGNGTFKLGPRPASADGCRLAIPLASRPSSADVCRASKAAVQRASAVGMNRALGDLLCHSQGRAVVPIPDLKGQQEFKSPLSQLQQSFRAELGFPSSTAAGLSGALLEAGQGHCKTNQTPGNHCHHTCPAEAELHTTAAPDLVHKTASSKDQDPEVSPETSFLQKLDQCRLSDSMLPALPSSHLDRQQQQQAETLSISFGDMPGAGRHAGSQPLQSMDLQSRQQVETSLFRSCTAQSEATAVVAAAEAASTAVAASKAEAYSHELSIGPGDDSRGSSAGVTAAWRPVRHDELCQLHALAADKTQRLRPRLFAESYGDSELHLLFASNSSPVSAVPAEPAAVTASSSASGSPAVHAMMLCSAASRQPDTICNDAEQPVLQTSPMVAAQSVYSRGQCLPVPPPGSSGPQQVSTSRSHVQQPVVQTTALAACSINSSSQDLPVSPAESGRRQQHMHPFRAETEHRDAGTDAMTANVETDHRQNTAWVEQRHWIAARRQSGRMDAKWELDESRSNSGDSEGSVSTESTLRPSSVGRCRVNSGRHAKVLLQMTVMDVIVCVNVIVLNTCVDQWFLLCRPVRGQTGCIGQSGLPDCAYICWKLEGACWLAVLLMQVAYHAHTT